MIVEYDNARGAGRTTQAMLAAPKDAYYVWCNERLDYPRRLAQHLGRNDLKIIAPADLRYLRMPLSGGRPAVAVDHFARLSAAEWDELDRITQEPY